MPKWQTFLKRRSILKHEIMCLYLFIQHLLKNEMNTAHKDFRLKIK